MKSILYLIAVAMVLFWLLGFLVLHASIFIHLLLALAVVFFLVGVLSRRRRA